MRSILKVVFLSVVTMCLFLPSALADNSVTRIDGKNRYAVAVNAAKKVGQHQVQLFL